MPGLLYTTMIWIMASPQHPASVHSKSSSHSARQQNSRASPTRFSQRIAAKQSSALHEPSESTTPLTRPSEAPSDSILITESYGADVNNEEPRRRRSRDVRRTPASQTALPGSIDSSPSAQVTEDVEEDEDDDDSSLKLGLGDFVFYSVLIARASLFDWTTTIACTVAVLSGLAMTIFILFVFQKPLPALPISIAFGILFFFVSSVMLTPYAQSLILVPEYPADLLEQQRLWVGTRSGGFIMI